MKKKKNYWTRQLKICRQEWARNNPERKECFAQAKVIPFQTTDLPKWLCAHCDGTFALSDVQCDHIEPIGNTVPQTLCEYLVCVKRLHVDVNGLQILCKTCHKFKTKEDQHKKMRENLIRVVSRYIAPFTMLENMDTQVLKKFKNVILKMDDPSSKDKACKKFDELCKKYL